MKTWTNVAIATTLMIDTVLNVKLIRSNGTIKQQILNTIEESGDCVDEVTGKQLDETECMEFLLNDILQDESNPQNHSGGIENGGADAGSMTAGELSDDEES